MKMAINNENEVKYMFYRKPQSNKFTMMARSALSSRVKRATMSNDALRRLLCCSPNLEEHKKVKVMEEYARMLKRSGYSQKFRHEIISDAVQGFENMKKRRASEAGLGAMMRRGGGGERMEREEDGTEESHVVQHQMENLPRR